MARWADAEGIAVLDAGGDYVPALREQFASDPLDWVFSVANLRRLSPALLKLAANGGVNFHDGPLPKYGGVHAPAWALMAGERDHGITWHRMTERLDAGEIILQRSFAIEEDDTSLTLNLKCFQAGVDSFAELLEILERGALHTRKHDLDRATYHRKRDRVPAAATLDWSQEPAKLATMVRALDFGGYRNTLGVAKAALPKQLLIVKSARPVPGGSGGNPGTVVRADESGIEVAVQHGTLLLESFATLEGMPVAALEVIARAGVVVGQKLPALSDPGREKLTALDRESAPHEDFWAKRLREQDPLELPSMPSAKTEPRARIDRGWRWQPVVKAPKKQLEQQRQIVALAGVCAWLGHISGRGAYDVSLATASLERDIEGIESWVMESVPLHADLARGSLPEFAESMAEELQRLRQAGIPLRDLIARTPELRNQSLASRVAIILSESVADLGPPSRCELAFAIDRNGGIRLGFDINAVDEERMRSFEAELAALFDSAVSGARVDQLSLVDEVTARRLALAMSGDVVALDPEATICSLFAAQASVTPTAIAVVGANRQLTYEQLDRESSHLARRLAALGVARDVPVGIYMERSADLLVAVLGILKAGGAYVPLDPSYPADRLGYMIDDSETPVIVTSASVASHIPRASVQVLTVEDALADMNGSDGIRVSAEASPASLAYVIYTSGSTGQPKGVMVEHRNVTSFFTAMDRVLGTKPVRWLAVTSLSFDISVLELLWPLTHGSTIIVHSDHGKNSPSRVAFSLFYFSADEGAGGADKYKLLLEGARFADQRGFAAVWTPERHFHEFGGIFPNPSVTGAAVAAITERIAIRAGSVVLPLHHPLRIAEEWSVVDNLSNGRVGVSFASGWRPEDFVLRPEGFKDAKKRMVEGIETVRRLWRGESLTFEGPDAKPVEVAIHPRPVQRELPVFITAAGSPDTFEIAGKTGAGVLTHLLGQTLDELKEKIAIYRSARRAAGHSGPGHVVLMLHTFVGDDDATVKEAVRGPMKAYLRTSVSLIEKNAQAFPTFKKRPDGSIPKLDFASLSEQDADALLDYSFERYFETSGMFGTVERCVAMTEKLEAIGVNEVACLIDFGVDPDVALRHLDSLDQVRARFVPPERTAIPQLLSDHRVTHLQCTPSQALLLLADDRARERLPQLEGLLVGGEAMPASLARSLSDLGVRRLVNMYGPTETTVWSTTHDVSSNDDSAPPPIGRPIANTMVRVAGLGGSAVPQGVSGELLIGGPGVTRGYLKRPDLTSDRFVKIGNDRMYRTGDRVRLNQKGELVFLGRGDTQVKVRGYRIELGEIERSLGRHSAVREAAVVAWGDQPENRRLVGYVVLRTELPDASSTLRDALRASLPDFMVPSQIVVLSDLPHTPNGKVDRKRLPSPDDPASRRLPVATPSADHSLRGPAPIAAAMRDGVGSVTATDLLETIAAIWRDVLHVGSVGPDENFFDVGGHSLLAVQVHQRLKTAIGRDFPITDLFRHSTVRSLATHLGTGGKVPDAGAGQGADRAAMRRQARERRLK